MTCVFIIINYRFFMLTKNICRTQNAAYFSVKIVLRKVLIKINQQTFTYFLNEHVNVN